MDSGLKSVQRVIDRYDGAIKMYFDLPTLTFHTILTLQAGKVLTFYTILT